MTKIQIGPVEICAAHIVHLAHETSKCQHLHGHNYIISVDLDGPIQSDGMIVDAHFIKDIIDTLDHKTLLTKSMTPHIEGASYTFTNPTNGNQYMLPTCDCAILDIPTTSAEHLSQYLCDRILNKFPRLEIIQVRVWETSKLGALSEYKRSDNE